MAFVGQKLAAMAQAHHKNLNVVQTSRWDQLPKRTLAYPAASPRMWSTSPNVECGSSNAMLQNIIGTKYSTGSTIYKAIGLNSLVMRAKNVSIRMHLRNPPRCHPRRHWLWLKPWIEGFIITLQWMFLQKDPMLGKVLLASPYKIHSLKILGDFHFWLCSYHTSALRPWHLLEP